MVVDMRIKVGRIKVINLAGPFLSHQIPAKRTHNILNGLPARCIMRFIHTGYQANIFGCSYDMM